MKIKLTEENFFEFVKECDRSTLCYLHSNQLTLFDFATFPFLLRYKSLQFTTSTY